MRILVIDDHALFVSALLRFLERLADEVVCVADAPSALERLARDDAFDLVLCDVLLPKMRGLELLGVLQARHPTLAPRVVFMTGEPMLDDARALARTHRVLPKPCDTSVLIRVVREASARGAVSRG